MKKKKVNVIILLLLVAMAVLLLYTGISSLRNMGSVIDNRNAATNGADYALFTLSAHADEIENIIKQQSATKQVEKEKVIFASGVKFYKDENTKKDASQLEFFFLDKGADREMSTIQLIDQGKTWKDDSIILPYYMKAGMGYRTGDKIHLIYKNQTYSFEIYGFTEDVIFATPTNVSAEKCFISNEYFQKYGEEWGNVGTFIRADLKDGSNIEQFESDMNQIFNTRIVDYKYLNNWSFNYSTMKYGASISANIFMGVLTAFSGLLIFIALIVVYFNITNFIEMNIKNIGMLEASGYTSIQMMLATTLEFFIISIFGIIIGLLFATGASDSIGGILSASIGLQWKIGFDIISAVISIVITLLLMLSSVIICSCKYRKMAPLDALRNGIHTHNFKKNRIRLDTVPMPLNIAIGVKSITYNKKKNIVVCLIIILLTFCANEAACIYENFAVHENTLIEVSGFETPDITVAVSGSDNKKLKETMKDIKQQVADTQGVSQVLEYTAFEMVCKHGEKQVTISCDAYDDTSALRINNVLEGRRPECDNEIMLTTAMTDKLGASIGDVIYLEMNGVKKDFLIVGISQGINHLGRKGMITKDGLQRYGKDITPACLYVYADAKTDLNGLIQKLHKNVSNANVTITNFHNYIDVTMSSILSAMKILCVVMVTIVALVIAMILVLLIFIQMVRDQQQLGIYKALGYTTRQLMLQTAMSYVTLVSIGVVAGCVLAWFGVNPSFVLCLSAFGIEKCNMYMSPVAMFGIVVGMILWTILISVLCSMRIRKIVPWKMMQEL
jgi:putative ABC transport system permease protein